MDQTNKAQDKISAAGYDLADWWRTYSDKECTQKNDFNIDNDNIIIAEDTVVYIKVKLLPVIKTPFALSYEGQWSKIWFYMQDDYESLEFILDSAPRDLNFGFTSDKAETEVTGDNGYNWIAYYSVDHPVEKTENVFNIQEILNNDRNTWGWNFGAAHGKTLKELGAEKITKVCLQSSSENKVLLVVNSVIATKKDGTKVHVTPVIEPWQNITLVEDINALKTTVKFLSESGDKVISEQTVKYGERVTPPPAPDKNGFIFADWYDEETNAPFDFETPIKQDITLRAKYKSSDAGIIGHKVKVYLFDQDGRDTGKDDSFVAKDGAYLRDALEPIMKNYIIKVFYLDREMRNPVELDTKITSDMTLYAKICDYSTPPSPPENASEIVYEAEQTQDGETFRVNVTFFNDETYVYKTELTGHWTQFPKITGTYKGNPAQNGVVITTAIKVYETPYEYKKVDTMPGPDEWEEHDLSNKPDEFFNYKFIISEDGQKATLIWNYEDDEETIPLTRKR